MILNIRSEDRAMTSICAHRLQGENCILDWAKVTVFYSYALWPLLRSGDIRKAYGESAARSHVRFTSYLLR
jgi:hypothetical protein